MCYMNTNLVYCVTIPNFNDGCTVLGQCLFICLCWLSLLFVGGIALDPSHFVSNDSNAVVDAWHLHYACMAAGKLVGDLQPDLLLLSTPHGIADLNSFSFYLNSKVICLPKYSTSSYSSLVLPLSHECPHPPSPPSYTFHIPHLSTSHLLPSSFTVVSPLFLFSSINLPTHPRFGSIFSIFNTVWVAMMILTSRPRALQTRTTVPVLHVATTLRWTWTTYKHAPSSINSK